MKREHDGALGVGSCFAASALPGRTHRQNLPWYTSGFE